MLLVIDVGNTNITLGVYKEEKLEAKFRMTTKLPRTSDEYGISLCDLIEHQGFEIRQIDAVIIASVVPDIMHSLTSAIIKRSEERRVGKECASMCRSRWSPYH